MPVVTSHRVRFEPAVPAHARVVAAHMRLQDAAEVRAGWGQEPEQAILTAIGRSPQYARTAFLGLEPLAVYGMAQLSWLGSSAEVWCFGTTAIDRHPIAFARASRVALAAMYRHAPTLTNHVPHVDKRAQRWLEWLGAKYPVGSQEWRHGYLFVQFVLSTREGAQCRRV